eukprot:TRINITY_DN2564_c0_g1_i1.p1 TRINITY_DN2564_c0_g1~~TRINITY_DN2564_c0_g1_i1.p1  ORF type:complete len:177 (+),score=2.57 TRINITY_DN2564_c0_g1_i1:257-787(+)
MKMSLGCMLSCPFFFLPLLLESALPRDVTCSCPFLREKKKNWRPPVFFFFSPFSLLSLFLPFVVFLVPFFHIACNFVLSSKDALRLAVASALFFFFFFLPEYTIESINNLQLQQKKRKKKGVKKETTSIEVSFFDSFFFPLFTRSSKWCYHTLKKNETSYLIPGASFFQVHPLYFF